MANYISVFYLLAACILVSHSHPTVKEVKKIEKNEKSAVICPTGESLDENGQCVKIIVPNKKIEKGDKTAVTCPAGETLDNNGKCVKIIVPNKKNEKGDKTTVTCPAGENLDKNGKCVKITTPNPKPTLSPEEQAKRKQLRKERKQKKRTIKKKLDDEIKEIKRLVLEGLEKGTIDLKCPDGKEINEAGECAEVLPAPTDAALDDKKSKRAKNLEKKLERELERVLKKEIHREIRKKRRNEQSKQKSTKKEADINKIDTPKSVAELSEQDVLPVCAEGAPADSKDCSPRTQPST